MHHRRRLQRQRKFANLGTPAHHDAWEALGATGWGWVCFRTLETDLDCDG